MAGLKLVKLLVCLLIIVPIMRKIFSRQLYPDLEEH
jgi:hypothetical protein